MSVLRDDAVRWAVERLDAGEVPASVGLDQLSDDPPPVRAVEVAIECLVAIDKVARGRDGGLEVMLTIPLDSDGFVLDLSSPSVAELRDQDWVYGPGLLVPRLHIQPMIVRFDSPRGEEYRRGLDDEGVPSGFIAHYRAWRLVGEIESGWEFNRSIDIRSFHEYVPERWW